MRNPTKIKVGNRTLDLTTPVVMSILNITPDSFWQQSRLTDEDKIARSADKAVEEGATILDIGGYSSRPGAANVNADEELERVLRGLKVIRERHPSMIISIDTFRSSVAAGAVKEYGPCIINDISAGDLDPNMVETVSELGVPYIAMHMKGTPRSMQQFTDYDDITEEVVTFFKSKIEELKSKGIQDIIIDPGFGFAKNIEQNYILLHRLKELGALGYPVLSGISRKSMIYNVLNTDPEHALSGTTALNWESLRNGASIIRVHDTKEAADIVKLFNFYTQSYGSEQ